jgi:hypothetical protein
MAGTRRTQPLDMNLGDIGGLYTAQLAPIMVRAIAVRLNLLRRYTDLLFPKDCTPDFVNNQFSTQEPQRENACAARGSYVVLSSFFGGVISGMEAQILVPESFDSIVNWPWN